MGEVVGVARLEAEGGEDSRVFVCGVNDSGLSTEPESCLTEVHNWIVGLWSFKPSSSASFLVKQDSFKRLIVREVHFCLTMFGALRDGPEKSIRALLVLFGLLKHDLKGEWIVQMAWGPWDWACLALNRVIFIQSC